MTEIRPTQPSDQPAIEALLDKALGPDRLKMTAYRLREGVDSVAELGRVALDGDVLRGSIAYWPVQVNLDTPRDGQDGVVPALLLGPLAVDPAIRGEGVGVQLMQETLHQARVQGHDLVILVGDLDYYERVGFHRDGTAGLRLPGPVDQNRVLMTSLQGHEYGPLDGALEAVGATQAVAAK